MLRLLVTGAAAALLTACAQPSPWSWLEAAPRAVEASPRQFSFDWQIDGDPGLAPLQVFDDGRRTWLQYPMDQAVPAVFERTVQGDRLLTPVRQGDYLVLDEVPAHLVMRGGHLAAEVRHVAGRPTVDRPAADDAVQVEAAPAPQPAVPSPVLTAGMAGSPAGPDDSVPAPVMTMASPAASVPLAAPVPLAVVPVPPPPPAPMAFQVSPADDNIRKALGRWARDAGWIFEAEHWAVDVDIPLTGSAILGDEFRSAVRALLAATELGERPLQPCFYANQVLRVIPLAQRCDRTSGPGRPS